MGLAAQVGDMGDSQAVAGAEEKTWAWFPPRHFTGGLGGPCVSGGLGRGREEGLAPGAGSGVLLSLEGVGQSGGTWSPLVWEGGSVSVFALRRLRWGFVSGGI